MSVLAWLTSALAGWFWACALLPRGGPGWIRRGLELALALAFGMGGAAAMFFALLWAGLMPARAAWAADAIVFVSGIILYWKRRGCWAEEHPPAPARAVPLPWLGGVAAAAGAAAFLASVYMVLAASPQGDWDAWVVWNVRAKFLAYDGLWRNAISPELAGAQPESPLLWPAAVARAWSESGAVTQAAPQAGAFFACLALVSLFFFGVAARAGWQWGALGTATLLMLTPLWRSAPGQSAEVPLAALMLAAVIAAASAQQARWDTAALALSGALASMAAFTRNGGLAFCVLLGVTLAAASRARVLAWVLGAAPVLALTAGFHLLLAPQKTVISAVSLGQPGRLAAALGGMAAEVWKLGDWPAHPLLLAALLWFAFRPGRPLQPLWPALVALLSLAAGVLWIWGSPEDAARLASSAADRLLLQVLPVLLLCFFWWLGRAEPQAAAPAQATAREKRKPKASSGAKH